MALGATHCGAGCSLADMLVEGGMFLLGPGFVVLGENIFGNWMVDYLAALVIGVVFQYTAMPPDHWPFGWMMQLAMLSGFITAYPVNWLLIRTGVKEAM